MSRLSPLVVALASTLLACAPEPVVPGQAEVLPPGGDWQGIYQGPYHTYLRIHVDGTQAAGQWRAPGNRVGEFSGVIDGNVLRFEWSEHTNGQQAWSGRGYFVYRRPTAGGPDEISGRWGLSGSSDGNSWWAVKREDLPPGASAEQVTELNARGDDQADETDLGCATCDDDFNDD